MRIIPTLFPTDPETLHNDGSQHEKLAGLHVVTHLLVELVSLKYVIPYKTYMHHTNGKYL
jgi:hypothetical protein